MNIAFVRKTPGPLERTLQDVFKFQARPEERDTPGTMPSARFVRVLEPPIPEFLLEKAALNRIGLPRWLLRGERHA